jgi:hypothetical protein
MFVARVMVFETGHLRNDAGARGTAGARSHNDCGGGRLLRMEPRAVVPHQRGAIRVESPRRLGWCVSGCYLRASSLGSNMVCHLSTREKDGLRGNHRTTPRGSEHEHVHRPSHDPCARTSTLGRALSLDLDPLPKETETKASSQTRRSDASGCENSDPFTSSVVLHHSGSPPIWNSSKLGFSTVVTFRYE